MPGLLMRHIHTDPVRAMLLLGLVLLAGCEPQGCDTMNSSFTGEESPRADGFLLGVEQDGQRYWARDHEIVIRRKPFRMVFIFPQMSSMLVQTSFDPSLIREAAGGTPLAEMCPPDAAVVEDSQNPYQLVYVGPPAYQNWLCLGPEVHRFDPGEANEVEGGYLCRRTVSRYVDQDIDPAAMIDVEQCPHDAMYMVFLKASRDQASRRFVERQRDWVTIRFR